MSPRKRASGEPPHRSEPIDPPSSVTGSSVTGVSLRGWSRRVPLVVLGLWLVLCGWSGLRWFDEVGASGDLVGLLAPADRPREDEPLLLVAIAEAPEAGEPTEPDDALLAAAMRIREQLGPAVVPIAAPASEVASWLDGYSLYLLPVERHPDLQARLRDEAIDRAVESIRARASSPMFGLSGEDVRRDPLGLRELGASAAMATVDVGPSGSSVTGAGDLLAADGRALLLQLRTDDALGDVLARARQAVADEPGIEVALVGPHRRTEIARELVSDRSPTLLAAALAGITLVLAAALRRVRPAIAIVVCVASAVAIAASFASELDLLSVAVLILLIGFGCEGGLHLQRISSRGWPAALVLATALAPLGLSSYPLWRAWAVQWAFGVVIVIVALRTVLPALLEVLRFDGPIRGRGFVLRPMRATALLLAGVALASGAWASETLPYAGADRIALGDAARTPEQLRLHEWFFDPALVAEARSSAESPAEALSRAASDARRLATEVPTTIERIDSPGALVLPLADLEERARALATLNLRSRLDRLEASLQSHGFDPAAFGEFLRTAADARARPSADAALDGPLGPWIERYLERGDEITTVRSFVHLDAHPDSAVPSVLDAEGQPIELYGPAVAARRDRDRFGDWLGIFALVQLWIGAFVVWLGTRSLAIAISAALSTLVTHTAVLTAMALLDIAVGPIVLPVILMVGAAATIAAGRACRAVDLERPFFALGLLTTSACQIAAGLALVSTGVPVWIDMGLVAAIGGAVASGTGLFVAPGMTLLLRTVVAPRLAAPAPAMASDGPAPDEPASDDEERTPLGPREGEPT